MDVARRRVVLSKSRYLLVLGPEPDSRQPCFYTSVYLKHHELKLPLIQIRFVKKYFYTYQQTAGVFP